MSVSQAAPRARASSSTEDVVRSLLKSIDAAAAADTPFRHWNLRACLPPDIAEDILGLPFPAPDLGGVSGKREIHNKDRIYFDAANQARHRACAAVAEALQDKRVTDRIGEAFGTDLAGSYLRIEYAQDPDGFWLEPHTDLGVKLYTMLLYISTEESHRDLGTDLYDTDRRHAGRSPFEPNAALVFVPSDITYHGFEKRPIEGMRKSVIINYVTDEWRAREQLSFPEHPVR